MNSRLEVSALFLSAILVLSPAASGFDNFLSDTAVREAYFVGQRRDERTIELLEKYRRRFPVPERGPHISMVELFTPYAEAVDLSRLQNQNYSAQKAEQEYRTRRNLVRVSVQVLFTPIYGPYQSHSLPAPDALSAVASARWSADFSRDFSVRAVENGRTLTPLDFRVHNTFALDRSRQRNLDRRPLFLTFDANEVSSDDVLVEVRLLRTLQVSSLVSTWLRCGETTELFMRKNPASCLSALFTICLLVPQHTAAFERPLSDIAVREAYFLGQRNDQKTAELLKLYTRSFPLPDNGLLHFRNSPAYSLCTGRR